MNSCSLSPYTFRTMNGVDTTVGWTMLEPAWLLRNVYDPKRFSRAESGDQAQHS